MPEFFFLMEDLDLFAYVKDKYFVDTKLAESIKTNSLVEKLILLIKGDAIELLKKNETARKMAVTCCMQQNLEKYRNSSTLRRLEELGLLTEKPDYYTFAEHFDEEKLRPDLARFLMRYKN